jgi:hypothetical protein
MAATPTLNDPLFGHLHQQGHLFGRVILDKRITRPGKQHRTEYLVQWQGYPIPEAT